jgi:alpha-glucosidase
MYVVYENPMPQVVDYPTTYENAPGFEFIARVPTVWDETRVLAAKVGDFIVVARRSGNDWYVGAMTDWTARELEIPLDFLKPGSYTAEVWSDGPETNENPNLLVKDRRTVPPPEKIKAKLSSGGGWVANIKLNAP